MKLISRFLSDPAQSFFLLGPRGTGKSTLLKERYPEALLMDLLEPALERSLRAYPERLDQILLANPDAKTVVIDEVQRVPELLSVVHSWIEKKTSMRFILTGSSARKLKRSQANLLGGRALKLSLYPFMAAELGSGFNLAQALINGLLPIVLDSKEPKKVLDAYLELYLREEVMMEGLVRNYDNFSRFLEVISFSHAQALNLSNIAHECEVKRKTVENYLSIIEDLMIAYRLPVFSKRAGRDLVSHPKFYIFDAGVFRALRPTGPLDRVEEIDGAAIEGLVFQHLQAFIDYRSDAHSLSFFRTRSGVEVDFIVYGPKFFWAIEVKNSRVVSHYDTKALESFLQDNPMAQAFLLYRGQEKLKIGRVLCIPCEDFLAQLSPFTQLKYGVNP